MPDIVRNFRLSPSVRHYYNVSYGVGENRRNEPLDVLLVQFLLNLLKGPGGGMFLRSPLATDGLCGRLTRTAIREFQVKWNRGPGTHKPRLDEDGVVSPGRGATRPANRTWTILALNLLAGNEASGVGIALFCRLHTHPGCPPRLHGFFASAPGRATLAALPAPAPPSPGQGSRGHSLQDFLSRRQGPQASRIGTPRPFNERDAGVAWAAQVMNPGRPMFNSYEWSEIMEAMEGTGDWSAAERWELLKQLVDHTLGEPFLSGFPDLTIQEAQELMRQESALGPVPRVRRPGR